MAMYNASLVSGAEIKINGEVLDVSNLEMTADVSRVFKNLYDITPLPYDFSCSSAVVYEDEIHILGSNLSGNGAKHYKWNGTSWTLASTLPHGFSGGLVVALSDGIHILGNNGIYGNSKNHYRWDGTSWSLISTLPYTYDKNAGLSYEDEIHIFPSSYYYKWNRTSWTKISDTPGFSITVVYEDEIHGFNSSNHYKRSFTETSTSSSTWKTVSDGKLPYDCSGSSGVVYEDEIHIMGNGRYTYSNYPYAQSHYKYDGVSITEDNSLSYMLCNGSAVVYRGEIYILGSYHPDYHKAWAKTEKSYSNIEIVSMVA